jgi:hypothetical protein
MAKPTESLPPLDTLQRYTVDEASAYLRQSRAKTYNDIAAGALESFNDGRRRYVTGSSIAARSRPAA